LAVALALRSEGVLKGLLPRFERATFAARKKAFLVPPRGSLTMISLRLWKQTPNASDKREVEIRNSIAEIRDFTPEQRAAVARGLAMLWDAFLDRFNGLDGFLEADSADRAAYVQELRSAVERMNQSENLLRSRYSRAPGLMSAYLASLVRRDSTVVGREFGKAVATLIEQGDKLRALQTKVGH
jgi:hypothetical protein